MNLEIGVKKGMLCAQIKNKFENIWATADPVQPSIAFFMFAERLSKIGSVLEWAKRISEGENSEFSTLNRLLQVYGMV